MRLVSLEHLLSNKSWNTKHEMAAAAHAAIVVPAKLDRAYDFTELQENSGSIDSVLSPPANKAGGPTTAVCLVSVCLSI